MVRNRVAAQDGRLYLECSGVNKVAIPQQSLFVAGSPDATSGTTLRGYTNVSAQEHSFDESFS